MENHRPATPSDSEHGSPSFAFESELVQMTAKIITSLRVNYPPKVAVSHLVNSLKGVSSRMLRQ